MQNRIQQHFERVPEDGPRMDFYRVVTSHDVFIVSREVAHALERQLAREPAPQWLVFRETYGCRHRILASAVKRISESTAAQRQAERDLIRARREEDKADRRPWEDEDWF